MFFIYNMILKFIYLLSVGSENFNLRTIFPFHLKTYNYLFVIIKMQTQNVTCIIFVVYPDEPRNV